MTALEVTGLCKKYRNGRGIDKVSFSVQEGEVFGLLGPNGCGKTTTFKIIAGLARPDSGSVRILGREVGPGREALVPVGCLIGSPAICNYISAEKNLVQAARYYSVPKTRVGEMLELTGLAPFSREKPRRFSAGMRQRLGLALALLSAPRLALLDEPEASLDIEAMAAVRDIVCRLAREEGVAFLIAGHLAYGLQQMCTRVAVMRSGRLIACAGMGEALASNDSLEAFYLKSAGFGAKGAL